MIHLLLEPLAARFFNNFFSEPTMGPVKISMVQSKLVRSSQILLLVWEGVNKNIYFPRTYFRHLQKPFDDCKGVRATMLVDE